MLEGFDTGLSATAELVDALKRQSGLSEDERSRLKTLLRTLISTISAYQNDLPSEIERFCDSPQEQTWLHLVAHVEALAGNVRRMMTVLEREQGDFVLSKYGTYREIAVTLGTRGRILSEVNAMVFPPSPEDLARLRSIAVTYRGLIAAISKSEEQLAQYIRDDGQAEKKTEDPRTTRTDVVILVHGIRDFALWQNSVKTPLKAAGFEVKLTNYGRLNLVRFLMPFAWFRKAAIKSIEEQIRMVQLEYPGKRISVIAHSFGTYVIASLLRDEFDFRLHRVVFCGSVVSHDFEFEQYTNRFQPDVLNEVGTADIWPAVAESVTWGYGSAGTYGFRRPYVTDRWHNRADHGYFLTPDFATTFWKPFLESGAVVPGSDPAEAPRGWVNAISVFKLKYVILLALTAALVAAVLALIAAFRPPPPPPPGPPIIEVLKDVDLGYAESAIVEKLGAATYGFGRSDISDADDYPLEADLQREGRYLDAVEREGFADATAYFNDRYRLATWRIGGALLIIRFDKPAAKVTALRVEMPLANGTGEACVNVAKLGPLRQIVKDGRLLCLGGATIRNFDDPAIGSIRTPYGAGGGWEASCEGTVNPGGATGQGSSLSLTCRKSGYPSSPLKYDITLGHEGAEAVQVAYSTFGGESDTADQKGRAFVQFVRKYGGREVNVIEMYAAN